MDRVKYVAKVSGFAIAAGVGVAMASGAGVAAADTGDSDSDGGASSSAPSNSDSGSNPSPGDTDANISAGPADPKSNDHSPSNKRSPKLPRVSTQASGAKSAASAKAESTESESAAGPSRRPGSSSATDRSEADAGDDAASVAGSATESAPAPAGVADTTVEPAEPEAVSVPPVVPSTTIVEVIAPPTKPNSPTNPTGMASVVEMLGAARRDTDSTVEVVPAAKPSPAATSPAAELLAAASSVAASLAAPSTPVVTSAAASVPVVVGVTAAPSSTGQPYKVGDTVYIDVEFDREVIVDGTVYLTLETGITDRVASAVSVAPSRTIRFSYVVQAGDKTVDLDYTSTAALALSGSSIRDATTNADADLTLPAPGTSGSLGANSNVAVNGVSPTGTVNVADNALKAGETSLVIFTFSEAVHGFTNADVTIPNGTLSAVSSSDGGITWTAMFTPAANITDFTNVIVLDNSGVANSLGNPGVGPSYSNNFGIDTQRPTATIVVSNPFVRAGENSLVTFTFSEAVTGFTNADLTVSNGTLSALSSSDGGITWTAVFTPVAGVADFTNLITLNNTGVSDLAGNAGVGVTSSNNISIDTQRPTATISVADTVLRDGQSTTVTFTFSEAVTGFNNSDISVTNGTLSTVSSIDGGVTWTATFTSTTNVTDATNVISVAMTGVTDVAGNAGVGIVDSNNYAVEDTKAPTATITMANTALKRGQSTTVTFTFSERVTGFDIGDVTVANGRLSGLSTADGGLTYTATFTPKSYVSDSTNTITLNSTGAGISDAVGNAYIGTTASANYSVKTVPGGIKGFVWHIYDFVVNQVIRPIGGFFHMLFFGPPPHLNHQLPVTPWSIDS
ncbi:Ig-like domain-containing protein [Mycolicibacterium sp. YH-1]|uniref:Ig-like domain-containing protein n=1 Tax=Mycolicibacterium sp. YH-1 TaxID=2908837 RepID=UPI001F4C3576|nr:Ig-like domain-containing protein [Mycolicibacterium sp. YH-1]UNB51969.1 Ig-like domain-containing protein [Mycolicibacterium sp. YH-1]